MPRARSRDTSGSSSSGSTHQHAVDVEPFDRRALEFRRRYQHQRQTFFHRDRRGHRRDFHQKAQPRGSGGHRERHRGQNGDRGRLSGAQPLRPQIGRIAEPRHRRGDPRAGLRIDVTAFVQHVGHRRRRNLRGLGDVDDPGPACQHWQRFRPEMATGAANACRNRQQKPGDCATTQLTLLRTWRSFYLIKSIYWASVKFTHAMPSQARYFGRRQPCPRRYFPSMKFFPPAS